MFVKDLAGLGLRPEDLSDFFMAYDFKTCHFSLSKLQLVSVSTGLHLGIETTTDQK
jgi:hypothetical protein